ncbi:hypothetical protein Mgra_00003652 [Meloidogyne graminicola]|uniref:Uncharacterized protein n=1 Tax=Meloidogyne graminicola TaxID=189291 RepID=A0A8S9ZT86_9BILA|nr:hypothetical protein Mgra_00003652 [Meloidogyne graminicola]
MHSNIISFIFWPISSNNIQKIFYLLFALILLFDGPVRGGYPVAFRKGLNDIRRMQELNPYNEDLYEFLDKRAAALIPYSGGIYGKRAMLPYSGGIYG